MATHESLPSAKGSSDSLPRGVAATEERQHDQHSVRSRLLAASVTPTPFEIYVKDYARADGDWRSVLSSDPFEVLFLDSHRFEGFTPELIEERAAVLRAFWDDVIRRMRTSGASRIAEKYGGESAVVSYPALLDRARGLLSTTSAIRAQREHLEARRLDAATTFFRERLEPMIAAGSIPSASLNKLCAQIEELHLSTTEAGSIIKGILEAHGFAPSPRNAPTQTIDQVAALRWTTTVADRADEIRHSDPYSCLGFQQFNPYARGHIVGLTAERIEAAYRDRLDWWRSTEGIAAASANDWSTDIAVDRIANARRVLLSALVKDTPTQPTPTQIVAPGPVTAPTRRTTQNKPIMFAAGLVVAMLGSTWFVLSMRMVRPPVVEREVVHAPSRDSTSAFASPALVPVDPPKTRPRQAPVPESRSSTAAASHPTAAASVIPTPVEAKPPAPPAIVVRSPTEQGDSLLADASNFLGAKSPGRAYLSAYKAAAIALQAQRAGNSEAKLESVRVRSENIQRLAMQLCDDKQDVTVNRTGCP